MKTLKLTNTEITALKNVLSICIDQYETSGGDIDYAELGEESLSTMQSLLSELNKMEEVTP